MMNSLVIKLGGSILRDLPSFFYTDLMDLMLEKDIQPVIVHGGGPEITELLNQLHHPTRFVKGMRVTTEDVLDVAEMVLSGSMNKQIVRAIHKSGGRAMGISGVDGMLLRATELDPKGELGYVGKVNSVDVDLLNVLLEMKMIPVISPIAVDDKGKRWNINADSVASVIAKAIQAPLCMITNVPGIVRNGSVLSKVSTEEIEILIKDSIISGGMIPKVEAAIDAIQSGVKNVVILNGLESHVIKKWVNGEPIGTSIIRAENQVLTEYESQE